MALFTSVLFLLGSCDFGKNSSSTKETLEKDVSSLKETNEFLMNSDDFKSSMIVEEKDGEFIYTFVFDSFKREHTHARTLVQLKSSKNEECFVYFGYDSEYRIVTEKKLQDKTKNIVFGYVIYAKFWAKCTEANVFFHSDQQEGYYQIKA